MGASNADYERQFKEIVAKAKAAYGAGAYDDSTLEFLIPGLRESEDERIRMKLFHTVRGTPKDNEWFEEISKEAMLAWLEKQKDSKVCKGNSKNFTIQKEQKPVEWSEDYEEIRDGVISDLCALKDWIIKYDTNWLANPVLKNIDKRISWLKSLSMRCPKSSDNWKPSEDEERLIKTSISFLKDFADKGYENAVECIDWLKSKLNGNSGK